MQKLRILCIDAERPILDLLTFHLEALGYDVSVTGSGNEAVALATKLMPALIILDLNLPDTSGLDICRIIRANPNTHKIPIIILTQTASEVDMVLAFELGADDYVLKPFGTRELLARVKAVLRRCRSIDTTQMIRVGPLTIDNENYEAFRNDVKLSLTLKEYELLKLLASSPGKVLTRDFLLDRIWGYDFYGETRTVDVHIRHIREKLGEDAELIQTVRGVGYKLKPPISA